MNFSRRALLKIAGISLIGAGIRPALEALGAGEAPRTLANPNRLAGKRWAMAIHTQKCPPGCKECIDACHREHNVPDFGNPKDGVKWLWSEPFRDVFPGQEHAYVDGRRKEKPVPVLHRRLPLRGQVHELPGPPPFHPEDQSEFPHPRQRGGGKM